MEIFGFEIYGETFFVTCEYANRAQFFCRLQNCANPIILLTNMALNALVQVVLFLLKDTFMELFLRQSFLGTVLRKRCLRIKKFRYAVNGLHTKNLRFWDLRSHHKKLAG